MARTPTARQREALEFFRDYIRRHARSPSEVELARHLRITPESAHGLVVRMERAGLVTRTPGAARSVVPTTAGVDARRDELEREAKAIVLLAFRNGPIEDAHAGKVCPACDGRPEYSRMSDDEMRAIMRTAVDRVFTLLAMKQDRSEEFRAYVRSASLQTTRWDRACEVSDM